MSDPYLRGFQMIAIIFLEGPQNSQKYLIIIHLDLKK